MTYGYGGYFNMSEKTFVAELSNSSSAEYVALVDEVKSEVRVFVCPMRVLLKGGSS